jgi:hypothetical protein
VRFGYATRATEIKSRNETVYFSSMDSSVLYALVESVRVSRTAMTFGERSV